MIESFVPPNLDPLDIEVSRLRKSCGSEPVIVEGLVSMQTQSAADGPMGTSYRFHYLSFEAWRVAQGPLRAEPACVYEIAG